MARRIDAYRIKRGDNLGDPELWNRRLEDIDLRIAANEEALSSLDAVANRVEQVALDRINNVITPLVEETQQRIASIPALFSATSASSVVLGAGEKSFTIPEGERTTWAVSTFVYAEKDGDPTVWLHGNLISFDREGGLLVIDVSDYSGSGSHAGWVFYVSGRRGAVGAEGAPGLTFRGGYSSVTSYAKNDVVRYDRSAWVARVSTTGNAPPLLPSASNAYWELLVERGSDGQETGAFETKYSETVTGSAKTTFTITGGYSPGAAKLAFLNGALLDESAYTATNGTTVVLASPASVGSKFDFRSFATFGVGVVPQLDLNLADLPSKDTALTNLGGTSIGRSVFKATTQAAARLAIDVPATVHGHAIGDVSDLQGSLDGIGDVASILSETLKQLPDDRKTVRPLRRLIEERIEGFHNALAAVKREHEFASIRVINLSVLARDVNKLIVNLDHEIKSPQSAEVVHWAGALVSTCEAHIADSVFDLGSIE
ncbi:MAG: hypothetical protein E2577_04600, partial [Starkeya sp.]|nr:hypothetical protein [Starkeya sp.]